MKVQAKKALVRLADKSLGYLIIIDSKGYDADDRSKAVVGYTEIPEKDLPAAIEAYGRQEDAKDPVVSKEEQEELRQSILFGQVVTELSTGSAAIKTARAGVSYPATRKAALAVCEGSKFEGSVNELMNKALAELKIG